MGLSIDKEEFDDSDQIRFAERLEQSLVALNGMLGRPAFGEGPTTLGAELELSIVDREGYALPINRSLLSQSLDHHLQLELDRFNLEYNLTPVSLSGEPFSALEAELTKAIGSLDYLAKAQGGRVVPIGILPTLRAEDLRHEALTDLPRYRALSAGLRRMRHCPFMICIDGPNPLKMTFDDVTLEGANTSFQVHLRVEPREFAAIYNAAQMTTPVALALGANSPIFLGHRLWDETRVALFKQSIDSRTPHEIELHRPSRVSFGQEWVQEGAYELFAEAVTLFPPLLPMMGSENPLECFQRGGLPRLDELRLHQGTIWRWNRAIYDHEMGGHLRIEFRALPSGPTPLDMAANAAFLVGMTLGLRSRVQELLPSFPFEFAHRNFYHAAKLGLDAVLLWPSSASSSPREIPLCQLALDMLPVAEQGLASFGVSEHEIRRMLEIIRARIECHVTGARWQRKVLDHLERQAPTSEALAQMLESYIQEAQQGRPVTEWSTDL